MGLKYSRRDVEKWKRMVRYLTQIRCLSKKESCVAIESKYGIPFRTLADYTAPSRYLHQSRHFNTRYVRTKRKLDLLLPKVFNGELRLSLRDVARRVDDRTGVLFQEKSLENILGKYESSRGCAPLIKVETGNYCLNPDFYKD